MRLPAITLTLLTGFCAGSTFAWEFPQHPTLILLVTVPLLVAFATATFFDARHRQQVWETLKACPSLYPELYREENFNLGLWRWIQAARGVMGLPPIDDAGERRIQ
jgi:hypothetical protein